MPRPTLASLAGELAVSRQTISNVLNAPHKVKPATRERVQAAIVAAGYRPSAAARQLRTQRSMNFGMRLLPATDGINGAVLDRFLHALTEAAQSAGYRLTLFCADSDRDEIRQYEQLLDVAGLDGFILTSSTPDDPGPGGCRNAARLSPFSAGPGMPPGTPQRRTTPGWTWTGPPERKRP